MPVSTRSIRVEGIVLLAVKLSKMAFQTYRGNRAWGNPDDATVVGEVSSSQESPPVLINAIEEIDN